MNDLMTGSSRSFLFFSSFFCNICLFIFQLLGFMYGWLTFYHQGYEVAKECRPYMTDLQVRLQKVSPELNLSNVSSPL